MLLPRTLVAAVAAFEASLVHATTYHRRHYHLVDTYDASNWFSMFDVLAIPDPTHGSVEYVSYDEAKRDGLAAIKDGQIYMGVDHKTNGLGTTRGRKSMRISSQQAYTTGLFIADIAHMPTSSKNGCGVWPAWWTFGPNWPTHGEIDIIEGVNAHWRNQMTLHTSTGCVMSSRGAAPDTIINGTDCQWYHGCQQITPDPTSYGAGFNYAGGGVYVMEWTEHAISVWLFSRGDALQRRLVADGGAAASLPAPDPTTFGQPRARFSGRGCNIPLHFADHNIIFDTTFCGDWAEPDFQADPMCKNLARTCQLYVADNAQDFAEAYWLINSVRVYQTHNGTAYNSSAHKTRHLDEPPRRRDAEFGAMWGA